MQKFDALILKRNINTLMQDKGITQQQLATVIGMSQSNVSKALSERDKKCFTVEQIFSIAEFFGISIDQLVGFETAKKIAHGPRAVGAFIAELIADGTAKCADVVVNEEVFQIVYNSHGYPEGKHEKRSNTYPALYFPNYWDPTELAHDEEELRELFSEAEQCGNDTRYVALNTFIRKYLDILRVYNQKQISEEAYQIVLKDYLSQLKED